MSFKRTIWIAVIFIGLGIFLFYIYIPWKVERTEEFEKQSQLFSFDGKDVTDIVVEYPDWKVSIKREGALDWRIVEPINSLANNVVVDNIVMYIPTMNILQVVDENPSDLSKYGLSSPAMKMFLTINGEEANVILGDDSAQSGSNYAIKNNDKRVILVPSELKKALMRSMNGWKKK